MSVLHADVALGDSEFARIRDLLFRRSGIALSDNKKALVTGRLQRRLSALGLPSYNAYLQYIGKPENQPELDRAIDLLTTNETYFWREPAHFRLAEDVARKCVAEGRELRIWSAACSSGEEVYTLAMVLQNLVDRGAPLRWQILGSDISERMLEKAVKGHYPLDRAQQLPPELLKRYCLRGTGTQDGTLLVGREVRANIRFAQINLIEALPDVGQFDMIFLRNVLIYFEMDTKRQVVAALCQHLRRGGVLCVGLAESLNGMLSGLAPVAPGAHRWMGAGG